MAKWTIMKKQIKGIGEKKNYPSWKVHYIVVGSSLYYFCWLWIPLYRDKIKTVRWGKELILHVSTLYMYAPIAKCERMSCFFALPKKKKKCLLATKKF